MLATITTTLALLSLISHITLGRIRYLSQLKEKQATKAQKAWVNGERQSADKLYRSIQQDLNDYELMKHYTIKLRAALFITTGITATITLGVHTL